MLQDCLTPISIAFSDKNKALKISRETSTFALVWCWLMSALCCAPVLAQAAPNVPIVPTGPLPTDVTPIRLREERDLLNPGPSLYLFQKLPANLWFNTSSEVNLRYESNVFLNATQPKRDIVFRTFPNVTVGYNFLKNTGIYSNYFLIKDVYADNYPGEVHLTRPTTQSVSLGFRHNRQIRRTNVQVDFQSRELFQNQGLHQFDYLPGILFSRSLTPHTYGFINLQLQMRGGTPFVAPTREIDPFYTVGILRSLGNFTFSITDTFISNYRSPTFPYSVPQQSNLEMISDIEVYHPIVKRYPNVVAFVRAEPIWNWRSNRVAGLSGFDFRLYTGIRVTFAKPPIGSLVNQMRKEMNTQPHEEPKDQPSPAPGQPNSQSTPGDSIMPLPSLSEVKLRDALPLVAAANTADKLVQRKEKKSIFQKLKALAASDDDQAPVQSPIIMVQNTMNPFGPMIPMLAPTQPTVAELQNRMKQQKRSNSEQISSDKNLTAAADARKTDSLK
jgi:hypothetical protein